MDISFDKLTIASVDTSNSLTLASVDTSDSLTLASVDTSDSLTLASVDTSDSLTLASVGTSDSLTLASVDTSDSLTLASVDTSDSLTLASVDTSDSLTLASVDTSDSLTLARLDRENEGPWEFEYSYGGEADLHRHMNRCKKNPGHKNFIPVDKFSIEDLPADYRDKDVVNYIRAVSDLTVRVSVKYVSDRRPATIPGSRILYAGFIDRGQRRMTVGTGWVDSVELCNVRMKDPCKCKDCQNSSTPEMNFGRIGINTAAHVVFDDLEGEHTTCHLFFDRGVTPDTCSGVVTLTGMCSVRSDVTNDTCYMEHYTHDLDLTRRLCQTMKQMCKLREDTRAKISKACNFKQNVDVLDKQPSLFIVSHPHGCSKQVSLGQLTSAGMFNNVIVTFLYDTATCPGTSGAQVHVLQQYRHVHMVTKLTHLHGVHCGASDEQLQVNFCRASGVAPKSKLVSVEMFELTKGAWEDNFCCIEEEDQNQHYAACKKNPGHENFFPVDKFSMDNLPPAHGRDDVMELIKVVSDLTVHVSVKYVSEERPETVPETDIPYPWFSNRGSNIVRVGTGCICYIDMQDGSDLRFTEYMNFAKPKKPLAFIGIRTTSHLVYDKLEADHTTCHLYFDYGKTPDACKSIVTLTDVDRFYSSTKDDICIIGYVTDNLDLGLRLRSILAKFTHGLHSLHTNDDLKSKQDDKQSDGVNRKQESPLSIVISHPHGCAKKISICCCCSTGNGDTEESHCSHSSIVCPGSSGATVTELSSKLLYPFVV